MQHETPAVVVGGNLNALGVARSLARARIPTYVVTPTRDCPAAWSRHAKTVRTPSLEGDQLIETLRGLATKLTCRSVLILTHDASVRTVSAERQQLDTSFYINLPDASILAMLSDKLAFDTLAVREGFPVPRNCAIRSTSDLNQIEKLVLPVILKPADKGRMHGSGVESAVRADTLAEAKRLAGSILAHNSDLIVQEWIEGPDSEIFFTFFCTRHDGSPAAFFTGRKLRSEPPRVGSTALCIPAPEFAEALERETRQFLQRVFYRGLGSLEFKRDIRTGRFLMVEPTVGRTDWQEEIATLSGVNLPEIAYWVALGHDPPPAASSGVRRRPAWRVSNEFRLPREFRADHRVTDAHFRWTDPLPGIYFYGYEHGIRRIWRRGYREFNRLFKQSERSL